MLARPRPQRPSPPAARHARRRRFMARVRLAALVAASAGLLSGCTGGLTTTGELLRILGTSLPDAYVDMPYAQAVQAVGGLRPYTFKLSEGQLPPGIELQGGELQGTPSQTGQYTFTIQVSDANLSTTVQQYTLSVTTVPPPTLDFNPPPTQVDRPVTLHVQLTDARGLEGLRTLVHWDPNAFQLVSGSVQPSRPGLALLQQASKGQLQVAIVPLGTQIDGQADLFQFRLEPVSGPATLTLYAQTEYVSAGGHAYNTAGTPPGNASPAAPAAGTGTAQGANTAPTTPRGTP